MARRGRALLPHPTVQYDDSGREIVTRQVIAFLTDAPMTSIRRHLSPVACHVETKAPLYDTDDARKWLATRRTRSS